MKGKDIKIGDVLLSEAFGNMVVESMEWCSGYVEVGFGDNGNKLYPLEKEIDGFVTADDLTAIDMDWMTEAGVSIVGEMESPVDLGSKVDRMQRLLLDVYHRGVIVGRSVTITSK